MGNSGQTLARRLGKTEHVSVLRFRIRALMRQYPAAGTGCIEDWLVAAANGRGARVVVPPDGPSASFAPPPLSAFSNEDLVVAICQLECLDRPQMLRLAAQLISRGAVDLKLLQLSGERERVEPVLAELARQALKVEPLHPVWRHIFDWYRNERPLREPLLHWTRLAEPLMKDGRCNAAGWRLVA